MILVTLTLAFASASAQGLNMVEISEYKWLISSWPGYLPEAGLHYHIAISLMSGL